MDVIQVMDDVRDMTREFENFKWSYITSDILAIRLHSRLYQHISATCLSFIKIKIHMVATGYLYNRNFHKTNGNFITC